MHRRSACEVLLRSSPSMTAGLHIPGMKLSVGAIFHKSHSARSLGVLMEISSMGSPTSSVSNTNDSMYLCWWFSTSTINMPPFESSLMTIQKAVSDLEQTNLNLKFSANPNCFVSRDKAVGFDTGAWNTEGEDILL